MCLFVMYLDDGRRDGEESLILSEIWIAQVDFLNQGLRTTQGTTIR